MRIDVRAITVSLMVLMSGSVYGQAGDVDEVASDTDSTADAIERAVSLTEQARDLRLKSLRRDERLHVGTRIARRSPILALDKANTANALLVEAMTLLGPLIAAERLGDPMTAPGAAFSQALLELGALHGTVRVQGDFPYPEPVGVDPLVDNFAPGGMRYCEMQLNGTAPTLSRELQQRLEEDNGGVGSVVVRVQSDESGIDLDRRVVAVAPAGEFAEAIAMVFERWEFELAPDESEPCSKAGVRYFAMPVLSTSAMRVRSLLAPDDEEQRTARPRGNRRSTKP